MESEELSEEEGNYAGVMMVIFELDGEEYAVPLSLIKEVVPKPQTTPVPQSKAHVVGLANIRGEIYAVLNLSKVTNQDIQKNEKVFLLVLNHQKFQVALEVQGIPKAEFVLDRAVDRTSEIVEGARKNKQFIDGIFANEDRMVILIDLIGMLSSDLAPSPVE